MKSFGKLGSVRFVLLALLLVTLSALPAAAQGPGDEGGDVGAAQSLHAGFCVNPNSNSVAGPACPAGTPQTVPSSGTAVTEVTVSAVDNLASVMIAFDYNSDVVRVKDVLPGSLFTNLTPGVDYTMDRGKIGGYGAPIDPVNEPAMPGPGGCGVNSTCWRSYVSITIFNFSSHKIPLSGNGSLIKIYWNVRPAAFGDDSIVTFPILSLADKSGSTIWPCLPSDGVNPNPYCGPMPIAFLPLNVAPDANLVVGSPSTAGLTFQVALEGGKQPGDDDPNTNFPTPEYFTDVTVVAGPFVDVADQFGNIVIPYSTAYPLVTVSRPGYLTAQAVNVRPHDDLGLVTLLAGDVTGDDVVNIFDLTVTAGSLNAPVGNSTALEIMDFNGDGVITIADLALIAKNYNMAGPRPMIVIP